MIAAKNPDTRKPSRRWYQFGIGTLFIATLLVAVALTVWRAYVAPYKTQRQGINALLELGLYVSTRAADGPTWQRWLIGDDDFVEVTSVKHYDETKPRLPTETRLPIDSRVINALAQLRSIDLLDLSATEVTDEQLQRITTISRIEQLYLRNTAIGDDGVKSLAKYRGLRRLDLNRTLVSDASLQTVGDFDQLEYFSLSSPNVQGHGVAHLSRLTALKDLQFTGRNVTNEWIAQIASLPNLEWVELHTTSVDEGAVEYIRRWKKVRKLYLNQNRFKVGALDRLWSDLPNLQTLEAGGNKPNIASDIIELPSERE